MAGMKIDIDLSKMLDFDILASDGLQELSARLLGHIGKETKRILKYEILSGQKLQYHKGSGPNEWTDRIGNPKASHRVTKKAKSVIIASYPANFFTGRAKSPNPQKKLPIWKDLKSKTDVKIASIVADFDRRYMDDVIKNMEVKASVRKIK